MGVVGRGREGASVALLMHRRYMEQAVSCDLAALERPGVPDIQKLARRGQLQGTHTSVREQRRRHYFGSTYLSDGAALDTIEELKSESAVCWGEVYAAKPGHAGCTVEFHHYVVGLGRVGDGVRNRSERKHLAEGILDPCSRDWAVLCRPARRRQ